MATKYTIKRGDTLDNIARQYGTTVQKLASANAIQDPNMIKSGQTLNIPENQSILGKVARTVFAPMLSGGKILSTGLSNNNMATESPVITDTEVNIGNIQPDIKPIREEVTVMSYKDNPDGTTTNYLSDGTTSTVRYNRTDSGALQPYEVTPGITTPQDTTGADDLTSRIGTLQKEITDLETSISNRSTNRQSAYQEAGIFDDIRTLNELKTNLKKAQDEEIAIGIEAEDRLEGRGATITEYGQTTSGDLRENLLKQLTASRQVESLTNIINTNTALINQKVDEQYQSDVFLLDNKNKRLDNIVKSYGDIMTENQKANLEAVKQQNAIELENIKFKNDLMKSASIEALKANPEKANEIFSAVQSGDISKVYQVSGKNTANIDETVNLINIVERMLDNEKGLSGSAGVKALFGGTALAPNANKFRTDAKTLASKATLDYYTRLKANGAVFGTMTESEWNLLSNASDVASLGINPETGKSILSDKELRQRLEEYSNAQMKIATAVAMEKLGIDPSILKDKDYLDIRENYYKRYIPKAYEQTSQQVDYTQQDTGATDFIQKEEGFSPTAYQDQAGVWTIGYGTTKINGVPVKQGDTVSEEQARQIALQQAVNDYSTFADKLGNVELTPNQFTALNSFEYNLGSGVWNQPTGQQILQAIANKDFQTASTLMQKFVNVKNPQTGKLEPNKGLISRRQREGQLLFS